MPRSGDHPSGVRRGTGPLVWLTPPYAIGALESTMAVIPRQLRGGSESSDHVAVRALDAVTLRTSCAASSHISVSVSFYEQPAGNLRHPTRAERGRLVWPDGQRLVRVRPTWHRPITKVDRLEERALAATLKDVALRAGVSPSTVSRVVRGLPIVRNDVKERVHAAIAEVGYRPNASARSIRTGVSHAVGFVVPDISNWYYSMVFRGAQDLLYEAGYELVLATSNGEIDRELHAVDSLLSRRVDGLILSLVDEQAAHLRGTLTGLPTVLLDRESNAIIADAILSDHAMGMTDAVRHLVELGHRRIALLTGTKSLYTSRARRTAFVRAALDLGLKESELSNIAGDQSVAAGKRNTIDLMKTRQHPTAIIAGSNQLLHGALTGLQELGLGCPEDVSLVACEDSYISQLYRPPISVVSRDVQLLGAEAASLLLERFAHAPAKGGATTGTDDPTVVVRKVLPTRFLARKSTGAPPR